MIRPILLSAKKNAGCVFFLLASFSFNLSASDYAQNPAPQHEECGNEKGCNLHGEHCKEYIDAEADKIICALKKSVESSSDSWGNFISTKLLNMMAYFRSLTTELMAEGEAVEINERMTTNITDCYRNEIYNVTIPAIEKLRDDWAHGNNTLEGKPAACCNHRETFEDAAHALVQVSFINFNLVAATKVYNETQTFAQHCAVSGFEEEIETEFTSLKNGTTATIEVTLEDNIVVIKEISDKGDINDDVEEVLECHEEEFTVDVCPSNDSSPAAKNSSWTDTAKRFLGWGQVKDNAQAKKESLNSLKKIYEKLTSIEITEEKEALELAKVVQAAGDINAGKRAPQFFASIADVDELDFSSQARNLERTAKKIRFAFDIATATDKLETSNEEISAMMKGGYDVCSASIGGCTPAFNSLANLPAIGSFSSTSALLGN